MKPRSLNLLSICTLTVCVLGAGQALAQDTWDGGAGTGNWADRQQLGGQYGTHHWRSQLRGCHLDDYQ